jgi:hypothetical protein
MDLQTIEMPQAEARQKFVEYRKAVRRRHVEEDAEIMRGYRRLAAGQQLIQLGPTLRAGGVTTRNGGTQWNRSNRYVLPRLAIARADEEFVFANGIRQDGGMTFFWNEGMNPHATAKNIRLPDGTWDLSEIEEVSGITTSAWRDAWVAMVPLVPPALRPERGVAGYHVLWEADWRMRTRPRPPHDPALRKHVGGDLYAVVAIWELTELERAVLTRRG